MRLVLLLWVDAAEWMRDAENSTVAVGAVFMCFLAAYRPLSRNLIVRSLEKPYFALVVWMLDHVTMPMFLSTSLIAHVVSLHEDSIGSAATTHAQASLGYSSPDLSSRSVLEMSL